MAAGRARSDFRRTLRSHGSDAEMRGAWEALGEGPGVVEQAVALEREISVMVARSPRGEVKVYPAAWNHHEEQILAWSVLPAPLPERLAARRARWPRPSPTLFCWKAFSRSSYL